MFQNVRQSKKIARRTTGAKGYYF
jgi:hypothetical protein